MESIRHYITQLFVLEHAEVTAIIGDNSPKRSKDALFCDQIFNDFVYEILYDRKEALSVAELNSLKLALNKKEHLLTFLLDGTDFFGKYYIFQTKEEVEQRENFWLIVFKSMIWRSKASSFTSFADTSIYAPAVLPIIEWIEVNCLDPGKTQGIEEVIVEVSAPAIGDTSAAYSSSSGFSEESTPQTFAQTAAFDPELADITIFSNEQFSQAIAAEDNTNLMLSHNIIPSTSPFINLVNDINLAFDSDFKGLFNSSSFISFASSLEVNPGVTDHIWSEEATQNTTVKGNKCNQSWQGTYCEVCHAFSVIRKVSNQKSARYLLGYEQCPGHNIDWLLAFQQCLLEEYVKNQLSFLGKITVKDLVIWEYLEEDMILVPAGDSNSTGNLEENLEG